MRMIEKRFFFSLTLFPSSSSSSFRCKNAKKTKYYFYIRLIHNVRASVVIEHWTREEVISHTSKRCLPNEHISTWSQLLSCLFHLVYYCFFSFSCVLCSVYSSIDLNSCHRALSAPCFCVCMRRLIKTNRHTYISIDRCIHIQIKEKNCETIFSDILFKFNIGLIDHLFYFSVSFTWILTNLSTFTIACVND